MSLKVSGEGSGDFELTPEGLYMARCYKLIDLGTQTITNNYGTKEKKQIIIGWELLDDPKMEDGKPFSVQRIYTASLAETSNLRPDLEKWRNRKFTEEELESFDLKSILGSYCQIQVAHSDDGKYANVQSIVVAKFSKDENGKVIGKPAPVNKDVSFDIDEPNMEVFESLTDYLKNKIAAAPEWRQRNKLKPSVETEDVVVEDMGDQINLDDIPF